MLVTIGNQANETLTDISVEIEQDDDEEIIDGFEWPDELDPGEDGEISASVEWEEESSVAVSLTINVSGEAFAAHVQGREVEVRCKCPVEPDPEGCGPGFWHENAMDNWWTETEAVGGYTTDELLGDVFDDDGLDPGWLNDLEEKGLGEAVSPTVGGPP